eukprot:121639-Chlamydomonas_euryale.AAC.9
MDCLKRTAAGHSSASTSRGLCPGSGSAGVMCSTAKPPPLAVASTTKPPQGALACDMALLSSGQSLRPPPLRDNSFSCRDSGGIWSSDDDDGNDDSPELPALSSRARSVQADSPK